MRLFSGHLSDVELVDFHPNALYLVTAANDNTIRLWSIENGECVRILYNYTKNSHVDSIGFTNSGKIMCIATGKSIVLYDLTKIGDPIRIIENFSDSPIYNIKFDNEDKVVTFSTEDYKIGFFDLHDLLDDDLPLSINYQQYADKLKCLYSYMTKKTSIIVMKYTNTNLLLVLGRFEDNDPKIFM